MLVINVLEQELVESSGNKEDHTNHKSVAAN